MAAYQVMKQVYYDNEDIFHLLAKMLLFPELLHPTTMLCPKENGSI
jgi:hypothetical protein